MNIVHLYIFVHLIQVCIASMGDRSDHFQICLQKCLTRNCTKYGEEFAKHNSPSFALKVLQWTCKEDCGYDCMWPTIEAFKKHNFKTPQFYGKWPFIRIVGIQEPASTIFSVLNLLVHLFMGSVFKRLVPPHSPMYRVWRGLTLVSINAWIWSAIFHARDTPLTEKLDYFCAFSLVVYNFHVFLVRVAMYDMRMSNAGIVCGSLLTTVVAAHVYNMMQRWDYAQHMRLCVGFGVVHGLGWLAWCWTHWNQSIRAYVWRCAVCVLLLNGLSLLELLDFPPLLWTLDAHSLWHLGTVPLIVMWLRFAIDDCHFLIQKRFEQEQELDTETRKNE